jgi:hypothetical protein
MANLVVTPQVANNGTNFEQQHVQHVYEEIAASMNDIQHKAWPNVKRFLKKFPPGALVADIGKIKIGFFSSFFWLFLFLCFCNYLTLKQIIF